jgi:hypothetical protein
MFGVENVACSTLMSMEREGWSSDALLSLVMLPTCRRVNLFSPATTVALPAAQALPPTVICPPSLFNLCLRINLVSWHLQSQVRLVHPPNPLVHVPYIHQDVSSPSRLARRQALAGPQVKN